MQEWKQHGGHRHTCFALVSPPPVRFFDPVILFDLFEHILTSLPLKRISFQELNFLRVARRDAPIILESQIFEHALMARPNGFG